MPRSSISLAVKAATSLLLLVVLLRNISIPYLARQIAEADPVFLVTACAAVALSVPLAALRWRVVLCSLRREAPPSARFFIDTTYISQFFGQVLPTTVGNDAVRGWLAYRAGVPMDALASSVLLDRLMALLGLVVLVLAILPQSIQVLDADASFGVAVSIGAIVVCAAGALWLGPAILTATAARWSRATVLANMAGLMRRSTLSRSSALAIAISVWIHINTVVSVYLSALAFAIPLALGTAFMAIPVVILFSAIPVSIAGWGVRETAMLIALGVFGMPADSATLLGLVLGLNVLISSLPGGVLWVLLKRANARANSVD